jgi:integrase
MLHQRSSLQRCGQRKAICAPTLGEVSLAAINTRNVQAFISALTAKRLTRKCCDNVLQTLSGLLKTAKAWGYIPAVFDRSVLSRPREGEKQEERFFTAAQAETIIYADEEPYATLWAVLSLTGCRPGEVFALINRFVAIRFMELVQFGFAVPHKFLMLAERR